MVTAPLTGIQRHDKFHRTRLPIKQAFSTKSELATALNGLKSELKLYFFFSMLRVHVAFEEPTVR